MTAHLHENKLVEGGVVIQNGMNVEHLPSGSSRLDFQQERREILLKDWNKGNGPRSPPLFNPPRGVSFLLLLFI